MFRAEALAHHVTWKEVYAWCLPLYAGFTWHRPFSIFKERIITDNGCTASRRTFFYIAATAQLLVGNVQ